MTEATISALYTYPVKSLVGLPVDTMQFDDFGPRGDRRFMVVDHKGRMVTQRTQPRLALIRPELELGSGDLVLHTPSLDSIFIDLSAERRTELEVRVHQDTCRGLDLGDDVAWWLGSALGIECRLVCLPADHERKVDLRFAGTTPVQVGYADGFPLMAMNEASVADFNVRLQQKGVEPGNIGHFRPNLVLTGLEPYGEDALYHLNFSVRAPNGNYRGVVLRFAKLNDRCVTINVRTDGHAVEVDSGILRTLATYRTMPEPTIGKRGVMLGVNLIPYTTHADATICVGDQLVHP
jgi:uncharacterized protein YcbX